jgi:hypothetical protein
MLDLVGLAGEEFDLGLDLVQLHVRLLVHGGHGQPLDLTLVHGLDGRSAPFVGVGEQVRILRNFLRIDGIYEIRVFTLLLVLLGHRLA